MLTRKDMNIVAVMRMANFWKITMSAKKRKSPDPNVAKNPLKILIPMFP
jgi:hypothetical protein